MRRKAFLVLIGLTGLLVLVSLGTWQVQRLQWKNAKLTEIASGMASPLASLPATPEESRDEYRAITLEGKIGLPELHVLTSHGQAGPGYRIIAPFILQDGRRILLDRGFVPEATKSVARQGGAMKINGNLLWPDDVTSYTPDPNLERNIWFGRDAAKMAHVLSTEPLFLVARSSTGEGIEPAPVTVNIANNHLEYAITWFGLSLVWAGMSLYFLVSQPLIARFKSS